jgi:hypothetical protein
VNQQLVVTATNNLALLLNEALENLEKESAEATDGDEQCENTGKGGGMKMIKEMSGNLKQQLQKMIDQMKNGQKPGKELGQALIQHEMMQEMLRELMNSGGLGNNAKDLMKEIDNLIEQNKRELMNKSVTDNLVNRHNLINTRLLEAETAENERDFDEKRESKSADQFFSNPGLFLDNQNKQKKTIEYMNKNSHKLNNFYSKKYRNFLGNIVKDK